ncbi:MAG: serine hydrolase [Planctomycetota bacterium]
MTADTAVQSRPWQALPELVGAPQLINAGDGLDGLFELPDRSAFTLARVEADGTLTTWRWRDTGRTGFYPASTIKWITGALAIRWMHEQGLPLDAVIQVGDDPPYPFRDLLLGMLTMSDNDHFNTLQELVGFAETRDALLDWGVDDGLLRRNFKRPRYNHSREARVWVDGRPGPTVAARPAAEVPLNPNFDGNAESNYFTTDDFVRVGAATLMRPEFRQSEHFEAFVQGLAYTNQCYTRLGLARVTAEFDHRPAFVVLNKPGWWPPDGAISELCYIYDRSRGEHYLLTVYAQGTQEEAKANISRAVHAVFRAIHTDPLAWERPDS